MKKINLDYDEVYKLYITQNLRKKELCKIFKCSMSVIDRFLNENKIQKPIDKQIECRKKGCLEKYGVDNPSKAEEIKQKKIDSCRQHFGVDHSLQSKAVRDKGKETIKEKYGVEYISQSAEIQEKIKQTNVNKYGIERYVNPKKAQETNLKKYGFKNATQNEDVKKKTRKTCLEKYGVDAVAKSDEVKEKIKNTNLKRYGTTCTLLNEEIKKKAIKTSLNRYGVKSYTQTQEYIDKTKKTSLERYGAEYYTKTKEFEEKVKHSNLERYGVEYPSQNKELQYKREQTCVERYGVKCVSQLQCVKNKVIEKKRENGTFNTSSSEMLIKSLLESLYTQVYYQHTSELYPFACDFYIPSEDVYIEYQGSWTHGHRPFDKSNEECLEQLELWKERARTSKYYQNAIEVWTKRDPIKRETAKKNNLNWIEFFTVDEFNNWFKSKKGK